jgi:threonyl-tRNA synthetase
LAPNQAIVLPISEKAHGYAQSLQEKFKKEGMRVSLDDRPEKIGAKIRHAELSKIPVMMIVGEKEANENTVSVRRRFIGDLLSSLMSEVNKRSQPHRENQ